MNHNETPDYDFLEDAGYGFMDSDGFHYYTQPEKPDPVRTIESAAKSVDYELSRAIEEERMEIAQAGWRPISIEELVRMFPYRPRGDNWWNVRFMSEDESSVSVFVDAEWREAWRGTPRYPGDGVWTIAYAKIEGIDLMRITNGFVSEPYFIREDRNAS